MLIPALMGIPLMLAQYGRLNSLIFGEILVTYPRRVFLTDIHLFSTLLNDEKDTLHLRKIKEIQKWIELNSGPLTADQMPNRVVSVCKMLMHRVKN